MREVCLKIEKIKCSGCIKTITEKLSRQEGLTDMRGDVYTKEIRFSLAQETNFKNILDILKEIGFPANE